MKSLSEKIASIEWLIDIAIIIFVLISGAIIILVVYSWYTFGLAPILRNPTVRAAVSALATATSTVVLIIYTRFTYKLFNTTRASLELNKKQIEEQKKSKELSEYNTN